MGKQMPVELEVSDPIEIELDPDLCVIKDMQGKNRVVIQSKVSTSALENLARDCIDELETTHFIARFLGQVGGWNREWYLLQRVHTIIILLGHGRFHEAIASTEEKWEREFAEAAEIEGNLEACKGCGRKRVYYDYAAPGIPDGYCHECDPAMAQSDDRSELKGAAN